MNTQKQIVLPTYEELQKQLIASQGEVISLQRKLDPTLRLDLDGKDDDVTMTAKSEIIRLQDKMNKYVEPLTQDEIDTVRRMKEQGDKVGLIAATTDIPKKLVRAILRQYPVTGEYPAE